MDTLTARIDPATVAAWFAAHPGVRAMRGKFVEFAPAPDGAPLRPWACCGLSALVADSPGGAGLLASLGRATWYPAAVPSDPFARIGLALGLDHDYVRGFVCGWDGIAPLADLDADAEMSAIRTGHADGRAAWEATTAVIP